MAIALAASWPLTCRAAPPDQVSLDISARLQVLTDSLADPGSRGLSAAILLAQAGLSMSTGTEPLPLAAALAVPDEPSPPDGAPKVQRLNMRLALTMLSQAYGDEENAVVVAAQAEPDLPALVLTEGWADLSDLLRLARAQGGPEDAGSGALLLRVPLVIWPGAGLDLGPEDELHLSRTDGAFILNFGELRVRGATIASAGEPNPRVPRFLPFVTTAGGGTLVMSGARLHALGFGDTPKFSGLSVLRSLIDQPQRPSRIEDSTFEDILSVSIGAETGILVRGNQFRGARGAALVVVGGRDAAVLGNVFTGRMPTNAIRVEGGSANGRIDGNLILGGDRAGIVVRDAGPGMIVAGNIVWHRDGSGIVLTGTDCGRVEGNLLIENAQKGIEIRDSRDGHVRGNRILSNENAAIWVSDQAPGALTSLVANEIAFNGAGLAGAQGGDLLLDGNDVSGQYLQFLSGDLITQTPHLARDMTGRDPMVLSAAGRSDPPVALPACAG